MKTKDEEIIKASKTWNGTPVQRARYNLKHIDSNCLTPVFLLTFLIFFACLREYGTLKAIVIWMAVANTLLAYAYRYELRNSILETEYLREDIKTLNKTV
jgi:hypothetical protein